MDKRFRLRKAGDFKLVREEGRSWAHPWIVLYARPNGLGLSRAGFAVGKRVGKAVARNRVKRLLRESMRGRLPALSPGWDMLLIARPSIVGIAFAPLDAAVGDLLRRARLLGGHVPVANDQGQVEIQ